MTTAALVVQCVTAFAKPARTTGDERYRAVELPHRSCPRYICRNRLVN